MWGLSGLVAACLVGLACLNFWALRQLSSHEKCPISTAALAAHTQGEEAKLFTALTVFLCSLYFPFRAQPASFEDGRRPNEILY
jgi:hypothetical protein